MRMSDIGIGSVVCEKWDDCDGLDHDGERIVPSFPNKVVRL